MSSAVILHQHTNNFGDDAAGMALVTEARRTLHLDDLDIYYIWHKGRGGLPVVAPGVRHHFPDLTSGLSDNRPRLAILTLLYAVLRVCPNNELRAIVTRCRKADVVFVAPAGSNLGIYRDWMYLLVLAVVTLSGVRVTFCQNTIGPSGSRLFDWLSVWLLRRSTVFTREKGSRDWLESRLVGAALGVDTAFLLHYDRPAIAQAPDAIAVVPTSLRGWHRDYRAHDDDQVLLGELPEGIAHVAKVRGLRIELVPHLYGPEQEEGLLSRIAERFRELGCQVSVVPVETYSGYVEALGGAVAVVSMRYHGLICASLASVPCVPIYYEEKMRDASRYLAVDNLGLEAGSLSGQDLAERLIRAIEERTELQAALLSRVDALRRIAMLPILNAQSSLLRQGSATKGDPPIEHQKDPEGDHPRGPSDRQAERATNS